MDKESERAATHEDYATTEDFDDLYVLVNEENIRLDFDMVFVLISRAFKQHPAGTWDRREAVKMVHTLIAVRERKKWTKKSSE